MSDQQELKPVTFLDKIEVEFAEAKAWAIRECGELMSLHNLFSDLKMKVLSHVAEHFGEDSDVGEQEVAPAQTVLDLSNTSTAPDGANAPT